MKKYSRLLAFVLILTFILPINMSSNLFINSEVEASGINQISSRGILFNSGKSSDQIRLLKDFFRARGDKNVPWGYNYDARTKELVRSFQRNNGLKADGIAGQGTLNKINQEIRRKGYNIGLRQPRVNVKGDLIIINKSSNTLHHMKNGRVYKSYPVATGKRAGLTPDGKHRVVVKYINPAWGGAGISKPIPGGAPNNPLGKRWIGLSIGGGGKYGIHGNSKPSSIGSYASLGCVRMFNPDVERLYREIGRGVPVWIGTEGTLERYGVRFVHALGNPSRPAPKPSKPAKPKDPYIVQKDAKLTLDGELINLRQPILNKDGTTYYPFREILEKVGTKVDWDNSNRVAIAEKDGTRLEIEIDTGVYIINGRKFILTQDKKPFLRNGSTYIPIRNIMEALDFEVGWDQNTMTVTLKSPVKEDTKPGDDFVSQDNFKLKLDGKIVNLQEPIITSNSRAYYPFREIIDTVGGKVEWDNEREVAVGTYRGNKIEIIRGTTDYIILNGKIRLLPEGQKVFINNSSKKTYMPIAFMMESLGFEVEWDELNQMVSLTSPVEEDAEKPIKPIEPLEPEDPEKPEEDSNNEDGFIDEDYFNN